MKTSILNFWAGAALAFAQPYTITTVVGGAPPATPAVAISSSIGAPQRVTVDSAGNVYFSSLNSVFQISASGTLTRIAGNSRAGYSGDGGPAVQAQLSGPAGLAIDASGDIFIADTGNNVVREVTPDGNIHTVAGNGTPGNSGDYDVATNAQLHGPSGVAVDGSGNLYIADSANNTIRQVTPDGTITTFAGDGYASLYPTPPNTAAPTRGELHNPQDVAVRPDGTVYIVDTGNSYIRLVSGGAISYVAGSGAFGFAGDGGAANTAATANDSGAALYGPRAIAFDTAGNYYLADSGNNRIRKIDTNGIITTVAGSDTTGFAGDGSAATSAGLNHPSGVVVDRQGNLYITDTANFRIRKVTSSGTISTIAGNGVANYSGDGGPAAGAQLNVPLGVAVDARGNLFVADSENRVVRVANKGGIVSIGGGALMLPRAVAVDAAGNAYVADSQDNRVRKIGTDGGVTTFAGNGTRGFGGDGGAAGSAQLSAPAAVAADILGNVFISDFGNQRIRKVGPDGTITTVAGNGSQGYTGDGGPAVSASFNQVLGVAVDGAGHLYIADTGNNVIREVTADGNINTIAGTGTPGYSGDGGPAASAQITSPSGIALDAGGSIYFTDGTARIRKIYPDGTITTIAGNGALGYSGDAGMATQAQLNAPAAVAVDASGNVYVADTGNNAVRVLQAGNQ